MTEIGTLFRRTTRAVGPDPSLDAVDLLLQHRLRPRMLPLIDLRLTSVAAPYKDPFKDEWSCEGHDVALLLDKLRAQTGSGKINLDRLLSEQLARGFSLNYVKRPILIWFSIRFDCVILSFSDKLDRYCPEWAVGIPGYFEQGRGVIEPNARPYAYWNGQNLHRLYPAESFAPRPDEDGETVATTDDKEFVCDFGSLFGWTVGEADAGTAAAIKSGGEDYWEYSVVPHDPEEIVRIGELRCVLLHTRYTLTA